MDLSTPLASVVGDARGRLLEAVVRSDRPRSIREWSRRAGVNHAHARTLLREFEGMGLVSSVQVGASTVVVAVPESALRQRLQGLFSVAQDIVEAARQGAQSAPPGVVVRLFGSLARESVREGSDVDLCILAPIEPATEEWIRSYIEKLQAVSCLPVNLLRFTPIEWDDAAVNGERIVDEIRRDGVELTGGGDELG
ncbi:MAG: nucleotidyltransferase domain-containing protein [Actinomycetota bacterium]|nr:nucleotidyltransferase domain-containing protein [Actinomycetota bacterium]